MARRHGARTGAARPTLIPGRPMNPLDPKVLLRAEMRERLRATTSGQWAVASVAVAARIRLLAAWRQARWVGAYVPMAREIDVLPLVAEALARGARVAIPGWDPALEAYGFREVRDLARDLVDGPHGARVPSGGCPAVDAGRLDFVLVPGIAFDATGGRLGRGKGFYDRLLAGCTGLTCGVGMDDQGVPLVPMEPHDVRLDLVVLPGGCHGPGSPAGQGRAGRGTSD